MPRNDKENAMSNVGYSERTGEPFYYTTSNSINRLDYFAGIAMQAMLSKPTYTFNDKSDLCKRAIEIATAMIKELDNANLA